MAATTRGKRRRSGSNDSHGNTSRQSSSSQSRTNNASTLKPLSKKEREMLLALQQRADGTVKPTPRKATGTSKPTDAVNEVAIQRKCA